MADDKADTPQTEKEAQKLEQKIADQGEKDAAAKVANPDQVYSRAANEDMGGESFNYGQKLTS